MEQVNEPAHVKHSGGQTYPIAEKGGQKYTGALSLWKIIGFHRCTTFVSSQ